MDAWFTSPQVDYAVADCSRPEGKPFDGFFVGDATGMGAADAAHVIAASESFHWHRHLLLVKQPDYLVVWDEISSSMPSEWFLHTTSKKLIWNKDLITSQTAYNADLDIHVLSPSDSLIPNEKEGLFGGPVKRDPRHPEQIKGKEGRYPFTKLKYFSILAKPGQDFITVLHPRKPNGAPLNATLISSSKEKITLKVINGARTDLITLGVDGASFQRDSSAPVVIPMQINHPHEL